MESAAATPPKWVKKYCVTTGRLLCKHCSKYFAQRGRRYLCKGCHEDPEVRKRYECCGNLNTGNRGTAVRGNEQDSSLPLPTPTEALPGTLEKLLVVEERARRGERLWHPDDAGYSLK